MTILIIYTCGLVLLLATICDVRSIQCPELPDKALKAILGTTYNARYMRINPPEEDSDMGRSGPKRASINDDQGFFMNEDFDDNLYEGIPAWEVDHVDIAEKRRKSRSKITSTKKRDTRQVFIEKIKPSSRKEVFQSRPWDCQAEIHWMDLGLDYFPRYIRTVKCAKKNCWYGHYTCKPKYFSIKVLRRRTGQCAKVSQRLRIITLDTMTDEFAQQWEFVEKAITFCCDCVMDF